MHLLIEGRCMPEPDIGVEECARNQWPCQKLSDQANDTMLDGPPHRQSTDEQEWYQKPQQQVLDHVTKKQRSGYGINWRDQCQECHERSTQKKHHLPSLHLIRGFPASLMSRI